MTNRVLRWIGVSIFALFAGVAQAADQLGKVDFANSCGPVVQEKVQRAVAMLHSFYYTATQKALRRGRP